jgi:hypothetical protein
MATGEDDLDTWIRDLASFDDLPPGDRMSTEHVRRRQEPLDDFRRLRDLIGIERGRLCAWTRT